MEGCIGRDGGMHRKRWRDAVKKDLQVMGISTRLWYKEVPDRRQ